MCLHVLTKDPRGHWQSIQVCSNGDIRLGLHLICSSAVLQVASASLSPSSTLPAPRSSPFWTCPPSCLCAAPSSRNENHMNNYLTLHAIASVALQIGRICLNKHVRASGVRPSQNVCALN